MNTLTNGTPNTPSQGRPYIVTISSIGGGLCSCVLVNPGSHVFQDKHHALGCSQHLQHQIDIRIFLIFTVLALRLTVLATLLVVPTPS